MAIVDWLSDFVWAVNCTNRRRRDDGKFWYCYFVLANNDHYLFLSYSIIYHQLLILTASQRV